MWRRIRNHGAAELLPQRNGYEPTSRQALELVQTAELRRNVVRHLVAEVEGASGDDNFRSTIGDVPAFRLPGFRDVASSDVSWSYLPTMFVVNVTEKDEGIEIAYIPDEKHDEVNLFLPLLFDNRERELWIDLRGYWGEESYITDGFVRPYHFSVDVIRGSWNATVRFVHRTRRQAGVLVGRVLVKQGQPYQNLLDRDFTMETRLERSEAVYAQQALQVPRLNASTTAMPGDACAIWVHGTVSCGLEGIKDLPALPQIPMYRFEHDTFREIGENADQLASLISGLGYSRTHIVAHSRGGLVARFCQHLLSNRHGKQSNVTTFGTPHLGTPMADGAAGGLALLMRAGDFIVDGIPYASEARRVASMFVGVDLPPGIKAMQPSSELLRSFVMLLHQDFESWAGVYHDNGIGVGYGTDINNIVAGIFASTMEHDLVVPTNSALGGNLATRVKTSHFDYFKQLAVQTFIAQLS